jgi:hypothetical protein
MDKNALLFSCCVAVKGNQRSLVADLQRSSFEFIPNSLFDILASESKSISSIKAQFNNQYDEVINEYFAFLEEKELIFFTDTPQYFPKMDLRWEEPFKITNAIIDINLLELSWANIIQEFEELGCKHVQIRSFQHKPLSFFDDILQKCENKRLVSVELIIKWQVDFTKEQLTDFCNSVN